MVTSSPGNAIDIHSFNGKNYIKTFNDANAATTLKGYALGDESVLDAKFTATVVEVASGANIVFNVYWVEKIFNFEYDLGVDGQGNPAPSSLTPPAPRQAGWTMRFRSRLGRARSQPGMVTRIRSGSTRTALAGSMFLLAQRFPPSQQLTTTRTPSSCVFCGQLIRHASPMLLRKVVLQRAVL